MGERSVSSINSVEKIGQPHAKEWNYLILYTKINSKWIKDLNVRPETIKLLKRKPSSKHLDTTPGNDFLYETPKQKQQTQK